MPDDGMRIISDVYKTEPQKAIGTLEMGWSLLGQFTKGVKQGVIVVPCRWESKTQPEKPSSLAIQKRINVIIMLPGQSDDLQRSQLWRHRHWQRHPFQVGQPSRAEMPGVDERGYGDTALMIFSIGNHRKTIGTHTGWWWLEPWNFMPFQKQLGMS